MIPTPTPDQAVHVLEILEQWAKRGWKYEVIGKIYEQGVCRCSYSHSEGLIWIRSSSYGVSNFDALCQATTVMQVLLEEHPEKP
jgi:hypothetical protein